MADELLERLKRVRPAGPPEGLRTAVVRAAQPLAWPWAAAAAALLGATVLLRVAAGAETGGIHQPQPDLRDAAVADLARALGGGEDAARLADAILLQERLRASARPLEVEERR